MAAQKPQLLRIVRDANNGAPIPVYSTSDGLEFAPVLDKRKSHVKATRPLASLMRHWEIRRGAEIDLLRALDDAAPEAAAAFRDAQGASTIGDFSAALDRFSRSLQVWRQGLGSLTRAADATIYHYTAPIFSLPQVWRKRLTEPSLVNLIARISSGTALETWQYYEEKFEAGLPSRDSSHAPGNTPTASEEREPLLFKLIFSKLDASITGRERERHEEMRGKDGAPDWDLYERRIDSISKQVWRDIARIMAFGDPAKGVRGLLEFEAGSVSGDLTGAGLLATGAVSYLAGNVSSYDNLNQEINRQAEQVDHDEELIADRLALPPADFDFLSRNLLDAGGQSGDRVLETFWAANPQLTAIDKAHELAPRARDQAVLEAHGVATAEAERLSGGIRVAGTQRSCMLLYRQDPEQLAWVEGVAMQVLSYPADRAQEDTVVRASCGGTQCFAKGAQGASDPTPGDECGAFRVTWR